MRCILSLFLLLFTSGTYCQCTLAGNSLASSYTSNNGGVGVMFNVTATNTVTILCYDLNLVLGTTGSYEVYYKPGSYIGSENNAANWILIGSNPSVPCVGFDYPSPLNIPINIVIPAGQTYAFYITSNSTATASGVRYTNGTGYANIASDPNLTIAGGVGKAYPFLATFANRHFNGTVHYSSGNALPVGLLSFSASPGSREVQLAWSTETEMNNDYFVLERSVNGTDWESLTNIDGAGNSHHALHYSFTDELPLEGISYYRIGQMDLDGTYTYLGVRSVHFETTIPLTEQLTVVPNPAKELITVYGTPEELSTLAVYDLYGRNLLSATDLFGQIDAGSLMVDISRVSPGTLVIRAGNRSARIVKE